MVYTIIEFPTMQYMNIIGEFFFGLRYLWMVLMEPALCNLLIFSPIIMSTMREHPVNTFMYLPSFISFFSTAIEMLFMLYHAE